MQAHAGTSSISSPIVTAFAGKATTTSFDVAAFFEKRHDHVLRTIDKVLRGSPESAKPNFGVCYENNTLQNGKPQKYYRLTRDGFTFVTMGFTGEKATRFKWAYIEAFNRMEAQLKGIVLPSPLITPAQQLAVRNAIAKRAKDSSVAYQTIYHALYTPTNSRKGDNESCLLFLCIHLRQLNKNKSLRHNTRVVFVSNPLRKACHYLRIHATIITTNERGNFNFSPNITEFFVVITVFFI